MDKTMIPDRILQRLSNGQECRRMVQPMEARAENEADCIVEGYACTFGEPYLLGGDGESELWESIDARAFDGCDMTDVIMQYDHEGRVFARNRNNTLDCTPDSHGLLTRATLGGTELGRQVYSEVKGGYSDKMSFRFRVAEDERVIREDHENNKVIVTRTITKISKLYDVSVVSIPANDMT